MKRFAFNAVRSALRALALTGLAGLVVPLLLPLSAIAQTNITVDNTLPVLTPGLIGAEPDGMTHLIGEEHGVRSGNNIFHSFDIFNVGLGDTANFRPDFQTDNIVARANSASTINGRLQTQVPSGAGNLFLINPYGIVFGADSSLDVQGSFHATTADVLRFQGGGVFEGVPTSSSVLSPMSPVAFGFLGTPIGSGIQVDGGSLEVPEGRELSLVSHDIEILGGPQPPNVPFNGKTPNLRVDGTSGLIRLIAVASAEDVSLQTPFDPTLRIGADFALPAGDAGTIQLLDGAIVRSEGELHVGAAETVDLIGSGFLFEDPQSSTLRRSILAGARLVDVDTRALSMDDGAQIFSDEQISITVETLVMSDPPLGASIEFNGNPVAEGTAILTRQGGDIDIVATESILLSGIQTGISAQSDRASLFGGFLSGAFTPGDTTIETPDLRVEGGAIITTRTGSGDDAGDIRLDLETLTVTSQNPPGPFSSERSRIQSSFEEDSGFGGTPGSAGSITIGGFSGARYTTRTVDLDRGNIETEGVGGSISIAATELVRLSGPGDFSRISTDNNFGPGVSGSIDIQTGALELSLGSSISSDTTSAFDAGRVDVDANTVSMSTGSTISSSTSAAGNAGDIVVAAASNLLIDGSGTEIRSDTVAEGDGGTIRLVAPNVTISQGASVSSASSSTADGAAGSVTVDTEALSLSTSNISSSSDGAITAGSVVIGGSDGALYETRTVMLDRSAIETVGINGSVSITASETTQLTGSSRISTDNDGDLGVSGSIGIQTGALEIANESVISSDTTNAFDAGEIRIDAATVAMTGGGKISSTTTADGTAGNIELVATTGISLDGDFTEITAQTLADGDGGTILLVAPTVTMSERARISSAAPTLGAIGDAGWIQIDAETLVMSSGSSIASSAVGAGAAGEVLIGDIVDAVYETAEVRLSDLSTISTSAVGGEAGRISVKAGLVSLSNLSTLDSTGDLANAGDIILDVTSLEMSDGRILSHTNGAGNAGLVDVTASASILVDGTGEFLGTAIGTSTFGEGDAGTVQLQAPTVTLSGGAVISSSAEFFGSGDAGTIAVDTESLIMSGSKISSESIGAGSAGEILIGDLPNSQYETAEVRLSDFSTIETRSFGGGASRAATISVKADTVSLNDTSTFQSDSDNLAGDIVLDVTDLELLNGRVSSQIFGAGQGGRVDVTAADSIVLDGNLSVIRTNTSGESPAGTVLLSAPSVTLSRGARITSTGGGANGGSAGSITLDTALLDMDTGEISTAAAFGGSTGANSAAAGSITIGGVSGGFATTDVRVANTARIQTTASGGAGGTITLSGGSVTVDNAIFESSQSESSPPGEAPEAAGDIFFTVEDLQLTNGAALRSDTVGDGAAGRVEVTATGPIVLEGAGTALSTVTSGEGNAGTIELTAPRVSMSQGASISSASTDAAAGDAGSVTVDTGVLRMASGASISSSSEGAGAAGSILIGKVAEPQYATREVRLKDSSITTRADAGPAVILGEGPAVTESRREGNITVNASRLILTEGESSITASVGTGLGGSVRLGDSVAPTAIVLFDDSRITARATGDDGLGGVAGRDQGGRIELTSDVVFRSQNAVISADAGAGASGIVNINSPVVNVEAGIAQLPSDFLNASALIRPTCAAQASGDQSSFSIASRRGVASSPEELLVAYDAAGDSAAAGLAENVAQIVTGGDELLLASNTLATSSANAAFRGGRFEEASEGYRELADRLVGEGDPMSRGSALRSLAESQQAMGRYATSLETLRGALALAEESGDNKGAASALGSLGNASIALGRKQEAEELLTRGMVLAKAEGEIELAANILNNLGNHHAAQNAFGSALSSYEESAELAAEGGHAIAEAKALANAARAAVDAGQIARAVSLMNRAAARSAAMEPSNDQIYLWIHQARTWEQLAEADAAQRAPGMLAAHGALERASQLAIEMKNDRALSYAKGNLGALYKKENRTNEALYLTRRALRAAERAEAPESEYRWHWQEGQLLWGEGRTSAAISSYRRAVAILEDTRQEAQGQYGSAAAYFQRSVAPVYLDLVDALLEASELLAERGSSDQLLLDARGTVEQLKAAELRDYFRNDCVAELASKTTTLQSASESASIIYPIVLPDRIELLVSTKSGLKRYAVEVDAKTLAKTVSRFRAELADSRSDAWRATSEKLYDWLVRPYASEIASQDIDTLVFVPDGALRTIPMAALSDGETVLGAQYALAVTPSLSLVDPKPLAREDVRVLAGGVSESVGGFPPLAMVPRELEAVQARYGGDVLLDADFQLARVEEMIAQTQPSIIHIASHAIFTGEPETSFLLTHDDKLTMERLSTAIGVTKFRDKPLELLVLSACETAAGDDRAGLGLAGVAIRAGARSAVGSLWSIADEAAFQLVDEFYRQLDDPNVSKAVALQRAQMKLRESEQFSHPYYWSPFLMINNWL